MLLYAMSILGIDTVLFLLRCFGCRLPCKIIPSHLYIIICELAELVVVHSEELSLFGRTKLQAWNKVDGEGEDGGYDEGVSCASYDIRDLDVELLVVVVDPASVDDACADAVQADYVVGREETVEKEADDSSDTWGYVSWFMYKCSGVILPCSANTSMLSSMWIQNFTTLLLELKRVRLGKTYSW